MLPFQSGHYQPQQSTERVLVPRWFPQTRQRQGQEFLRPLPGQLQGAVDYESHGSEAATSIFQHMVNPYGFKALK